MANDRIPPGMKLFFKTILKPKHDEIIEGAVEIKGNSILVDFPKDICMIFDRFNSEVKTKGTATQFLDYEDIKKKGLNVDLMRSVLIEIFDKHSIYHITVKDVPTFTIELKNKNYYGG